MLLAGVLAPASAAHAESLKISPQKSAYGASLQGHKGGAVRFVLDGKTIAVDRKGPFTVRIARKGLKKHRPVLSARTAQNGRTLAAATLSGAAPSITFTSVPAATTTATTATVAWSVTNATRVFCRIDGGPLTRCSSPKYLTGLRVGQHSVKVRADNGSGYATAIAEWEVVSSTATPPPPPPPPPPSDPLPPPPPPPVVSGVPTASVGVPAGTELSGLATLTATATAAKGRLLWIDFLVDGKVVGSDNYAPYSYTLDASRLAAGPHNVQVMAWDEGFAPGTSASVLVTTSSTPRYSATVSTASALQPALNALASSGGSVFLAPGTYTVSGTVTIPARVTLVGAGRSATTLRASGARTSATVLLNGAGSSLRGVTVDAAGGTGRAVEVSRSNITDAVVQDVAVTGLGSNAIGIEVWGSHHGVSVQDSFVDGGGIASKGMHDWLGDNVSTDSGVFRTTFQNFRDFGILFHAWQNNQAMPGERAIAVRNTVRNIDNSATNNGTNEAGIWLGGRNNVAYGNTIDGTGWEGVWTGGDHSRPIVHSNVIRNTKQVGIYLEHSSDDARIESNQITATGTGINVEWTYGGVGTQRVSVLRNSIVGVRNGVFLDTGSHDSVVAGNSILDSTDSAIVLQGVLRTVVRDNDLRDTKATATQGYCVRESTGLTDSGNRIRSDYHTHTGNDCRGSVRGVVAIDGGHSTLSGNLWK